MKIFYNKSELKDYAAQVHRKGNALGLVPTMGALHEGHLTLVKNALHEENQETLVSIFVNPIQFNNPEDFEKYPVSTEQDLEMLRKAGVHAVYLPKPETIYPKPVRIKMSFKGLDDVMEGKHRPGHFSGVAVVVSKLFHLSKADRAYFGMKDLQQCRIIQQLVSDLNFDIEICEVPIVREDDGLAMSSRNRRLSNEERKQAPFISRMLNEGCRLLKSGKKPTDVKNYVIDEFKKHQEFDLEYYEIVCADSLKSFEDSDGLEEGSRVAICTAAHLGNVRLIDNLIFPV